MLRETGTGYSVAANSALRRGRNSDIGSLNELEDAMNDGCDVVINLTGRSVNSCRTGYRAVDPRSARVAPSEHGV
ncbi:MAG TPA: hypothetical protein VGY48_25670 [Vicinamibacterales bacterium]|nr:hypothetical protein [Vicinamibacterales bacterium]